MSHVPSPEEFDLDGFGFEDSAPPWDADEALTPPPVLASATPSEVRDVLRRALAATHERPASQLLGLIAQIKASPRLLVTLTESMQLAYAGVFEALLFEAANLTPSAEISLGDVAAIENHTHAARAELTEIHRIAELGQAAQRPAARIAAMVEHLQAQASKRSLETVIDAIDAEATAEVKMTAFARIVTPTTQVAVVRESGVKTALDLASSVNPAEEMRYSSGYRTLDHAFSQDNEPLGFIAPGEQTVIAGPTGTGKSSMQYALTRNMAMDQRNWGYPDAPVVLLHTEEESVVKAEAMELLPGQRHHNLAGMVVIENIGSSRKKIAEVIYNLVVNAVEKSQAQSRPVSDFLPRVGFLDYIQAVIDPGEQLNVAHIATSSLILRGLQSFNPDEIAKFSKVDFRTFTGQSWPDGIEGHRMAWMVFAQLRKDGSDASVTYKANSRAPLSDFTMEDVSDTPGWVDSSENGWAWEVRENDLRLFRQSDIYGSSEILNNATNIVLLHRSRPRQNPSSLGADGHMHLMDIRARLIPDKARNGIKMPYVPMAFDVQPSGFRAQFYDLLGEKALETGRFAPAEGWRISGDPILPSRPAPSPFAGVAY